MKDPKSSTSLQKADTDVLVQRAGSGDCDGFAELMLRYDSLVHRTAYSILKNLEDAEDVAQESYLKVFRNIHTFEGSSKFSTWLTRIVINTSLMRLRQKRSRPVFSLEELTDGDVSSFLPLADSYLDPEHQSCSADLRGRLYEAVCELPEQLREIARDQIYAELSVKDLANRSGITIAAAKSRAYRARKILVGSLRRPLIRFQAFGGAGAMNRKGETCPLVSPRSDHPRNESARDT